MTLMLLSQLATAQKIFDQEFLTENIQQVVLSNISGPIEVGRSEGKKITVLVKLEDGTLDPELSVDYKRENNYLIIYLRTPCTKAKNLLSLDPANPTQTKFWEDDCSWNHFEKEDIPVLSFEVRLPSGLDLSSTTIMDGDITVKDAGGKIWASNVNGGIILMDVNSVIMAKTVNGNIDIRYEKNPVNDAEFHTVNGDIKISLPERSNLTTSFKSFQGKFYTDFESARLLPRQIAQASKNRGFKYRLDNRKQIEINGGGVMISIETFHGDAFVTHAQ